MITVEEADKIVLAQTKDYGTESIYFENALGRVLAEDLKADRDLPPCNRVTVDGIAISFAAFNMGVRSFKIHALQAAGDAPVEIDSPDACIEIMTGASLPVTTDTVIRYEDLEIKEGFATVTTDSIKEAQNIHKKGIDKKKDQLAVAANQFISPAVIQIAASVGKTKLIVKKLPKTVIISSGDELVEVNISPLPYQVRRSNNYTLKAMLQRYGIEADLLHIPDDAAITKDYIEKSLQQYDLIILSGGVSMGKYDYIAKALEDCNVKKLFHKVAQRPGKPFWFGRHQNGVLVFAFPGNPVSAFMCFTRYLIPWLEKCLCIATKNNYAVLNEDFTFNIPLQYFLQVRLSMNATAQLLATPIAGNGSGDFSNLVATDAFMELPLLRNNFKKGEVFSIWPFAY